MNLRVNNVEIPNSKRIEVSLQYIFGIGETTAQTILRDTVRRPKNAAQGRAQMPPRSCSCNLHDCRAWRTRRPMS